MTWTQAMQHCRDGICLPTLAAAAVLALFTACSPDTGTRPATTATPTVNGGTPSPTATPTTPPTTTTTAGPQPTATAPPNEPAGRAPSAEPAQRPMPFVADTRPDVSTEREGYPVLVAVRQGEHQGYRRYVFHFEHADPEGRQPWRKYARPSWDARYVPGSEAVMDGSGDPVANAGAPAHLRIQFQADMHYADGRSSLRSSVSDEPPDLVFGGDFENQVTWFYGADKEQPFRVFYVGEGRVAVDIVR